MIDELRRWSTPVRAPTDPGAGAGRARGTSPCPRQARPPGRVPRGEPRGARRRRTRARRVRARQPDGRRSATSWSGSALVAATDQIPTAGGGGGRGRRRGHADDAANRQGRWSFRWCSSPCHRARGLPASCGSIGRPAGARPRSRGSRTWPRPAPSTAVRVPRPSPDAWAEPVHNPASASSSNGEAELGPGTRGRASWPRVPDAQTSGRAGQAARTGRYSPQPCISRLRGPGGSATTSGASQSRTREPQKREVTALAPGDRVLHDTASATARVVASRASPTRWWPR